MSDSTVVGIPYSENSMSSVEIAVSSVFDVTNSTIENLEKSLKISRRLSYLGLGPNIYTDFHGWAVRAW